MQKLLNTYPLPCPENFMDRLGERLGVKNDAQLARLLRLLPPAISKMRHGVAPLTAEIMLRIHEAGGVPLDEIRELARVEAPVYPALADVVSQRDRRVSRREMLGLTA